MLGHEIGHVARKHTVNAIQKNKAVATGRQSSGRRPRDCSSAWPTRPTRWSSRTHFDRGDELDADRVGVRAGTEGRLRWPRLGQFLTRLDERNKDQAENATDCLRRTRRRRSASTRIQQLGGCRRRQQHSSRRVTRRTSSTSRRAITSIAVVDRRVRRSRRIEAPTDEGYGEEGRAQEEAASAWAALKPARAPRRSRARKCPLPAAPADSAPIGPPRAAATRRS